MSVQWSRVGALCFRKYCKQVFRTDLTAIYPGHIQHEAVTFLYKLAKIKSIHIYTISGRSFDSRPPAQKQVCGVLPVA